MGFVATVVEFLRSVVDGAEAPEAKVDRGGDDTVTGYHFASPGDDAQPLAGDAAYLGDDLGSGAAQITGYQDPTTAPKAGAGEKRIYSRSGPGVMAAEVWLKADGSIVIANAAGSVELAADGSSQMVNPLGSVALDAAGGVTFTTPLGTFTGDLHQHLSPFGPTGPPIAGT